MDKLGQGPGPRAGMRPRLAPGTRLRLRDIWRCSLTVRRAWALSGFGLRFGSSWTRLSIAFKSRTSITRPEKLDRLLAERSGHEFITSPGIELALRSLAHSTGTCTRPIDKLYCVSGYFKAIKLKYKTVPKPKPKPGPRPSLKRGAIQFQLRTWIGKIILSHVPLTAKAIDLINLPAAFTESIRKYSLEIRWSDELLTGRAFKYSVVHTEIHKDKYIGEHMLATKLYL